PVHSMVYTHLPSNIILGFIPLIPSFEWAAALLIFRFTFSQMDTPVRQAMVMAIVSPGDRPRAAALTNAVRPAAAALGPAVAGVTMASPWIGLPFYVASAIKASYDIAIFTQFHKLDAKLLETTRA
ncbi:MAG: MFS transporter, partial [Vulcanimicrobiaceae bacterium]